MPRSGVRRDDGHLIKPRVRKPVEHPALPPANESVPRGGCDGHGHQQRPWTLSWPGRERTPILRERDGAFHLNHTISEAAPQLGWEGHLGPWQSALEGRRNCIAHAPLPTQRRRGREGHHHLLIVYCGPDDFSYQLSILEIRRWRFREVK